MRRKSHLAPGSFYTAVTRGSAFRRPARSRKRGGRAIPVCGRSNRTGHRQYPWQLSSTHSPCNLSRLVAAAFVAYDGGMRCSASGVVALVLAGVAGCSPLPGEPQMQGPREVRDGAHVAPAMVVATRELSWASPDRLVKITLGSRVCRRAPSSSACVRLSAQDRRELDRFFTNDSFRSRWTAFGACPARIGGDGDTTVFSVTYASGERITKPLDAPMGTPATRRCDRSARDAIAAIEEDLVRRYFP